MLLAIRKQISPATVMALGALVFAMSGGAYALTDNNGVGSQAGASVPTGRSGSGSTLATAAKAKKKSKSTSGARGPAGPAGKTGAQGPAGAPGATGPAGAAGPQGEKGVAGTNGTDGVGTEGKEGKEGSPWTDGGTLPAEKTEKGDWAIFATATAAEQQFGFPISFVIPLENGLGTSAVHFINKNGEEVTTSGDVANTGACKGGTAKSPTAEEGNLCIYAFNETNVEPSYKEISTIDPEGSGFTFDEAGKAGTIIVAQSVAEGAVEEYGTWAVTAN
jgi:Collagen triple helix repeat (20 copies)